MRNLLIENTFKRDMKRLQKRSWHLNDLYQYIKLLQNYKELPLQARPHKLSGEYDGFWECQIKNDWLLIYSFTQEILLLVRTGSHGDLFE
ncbi:type II toxin-antitoxin system YafQ family toxin [Candidatus Azambacteria bacterium]|nr:type II toxin-antitoxin system YafQ family toxin [Candidatus Azambacteria bacterium]